ncbi:MAG: alpha/beta fold hydrolase [Desulfofustis sp.]|nr:alpha/beta fold hydrolase [Desulfofustis sp.]
MKLYSRIIGSGPPVLILHGLFGMSDNWVTIGNGLAAQGFCVHLIDLRNHGSSPHAETHRYPDMCDDLLFYLEQKNLETVDIIGHSMGGKVAMIFGLLDPEKLKKLIVVDIAPSDYRDPENSFHAAIINGLEQIDLSTHSGRGSIRKNLTEILGDRELAMFLAKNIDRDKRSKRFKWKCNLPVLKKYLQHIYIGLEELELYAPCPVKTLFIRGNDSVYYLPEHERDRLFFFPESAVVGIDDAGHWVHSAQPEKFLQSVSSFLLS